MRYDRLKMPLPIEISRFVRLGGTLLMLALATGCASHRGSQVASHGMYKVGAPYTIDGTTYTPQEEFNHTETGTASWYGPGFHGKYTANGEVYDQAARTAAHRTLQLPCVVRVTNLENGQSTVVRVNDRGPYARNRIMDVSRATAETLGMVGKGTARIRIDQLDAESRTVKEVAMNGGGPAEQEAALARLGRGAPPPQAATAVAQAPTTSSWSPSEPPPPAPADSPRPFTSSNNATIASLANHPPGGYYVQTGAFSTMANAERQRGLVTSYGTTEITSGSTAGHEVFRVRVGPYTTPDAAGIMADRLKRSGYGDARVVAD
jgi:rare lipoprotein A